MQSRIIELALEKPELSPREIAVSFTDRESYFVSEASVYRLLKAHDLITSPAFIVVKAADEFHTKTTAPDQLWQTDFTYLKVIGWGWFYLSTILDDFSRYIIAWKLCTTMTAGDVTRTLEGARYGRQQSSDMRLGQPAHQVRGRLTCKQEQHSEWASPSRLHPGQRYPSDKRRNSRAAAAPLPTCADPSIARSFHYSRRRMFHGNAPVASINPVRFFR